jgi:microcystin-dependent protein
MPQPFVGELKLVSFNFSPPAWAAANGQILAIPSNTPLFALIGTTFGGNGSTTFALPDLRGSVPIHMSPQYARGSKSGEPGHTLTTQEIPAHNHVLQGINATQNTSNPANNFLANTTVPFVPYAQSVNLVKMFAGDISTAGGSLPHENQSPYLVMNWIIALQGIFPTRG